MRCTIASSDHGVITVPGDYRLKVATALSGTTARSLLEGLDDQPMKLSIHAGLHPAPEHLRWHQKEVFHGPT